MMQRVREQGLGITLVSAFLVVCYLFPSSRSAMSSRFRRS